MPKKSALEIWEAEARKIPAEEAAVRQPIHVQTGEAVDLSKVVVRYWDAVIDAKTGAVIRPGLETLGERLAATAAADLISQQQALQEAQTAYLLAVGQRASDPERRARFVLNELVSAIEYYADDGVEDDTDAQLAAVEQSHAGHPATTDALAAELQDFAALAQAHQEGLDGLGGFQVGLIPEAFELAVKLRDKPATPAAAVDPKVRDALLLRNQMATLLGRTVAKTRSAIRFVFRNHPEIIRESTSTYERRKRAESRRKQKAAGGKPEPITNE